MTKPSLEKRIADILEGWKAAHDESPGLKLFDYLAVLRVAHGLENSEEGEKWETHIKRLGKEGRYVG